MNCIDQLQASKYVVSEGTDNKQTNRPSDFLGSWLKPEPKILDVFSAHIVPNCFKYRLTSSLEKIQPMELFVVVLYTYV